jgi:arylformamidase
VRNAARGSRPTVKSDLPHLADHPETKAQSQRLVKVLQGAGISAKAYPAEGKNHTTINNDLGIADDRPTQEMFSFLNAVLKK